MRTIFLLPTLLFLSACSHSYFNASIHIKSVRYLNPNQRQASPLKISIIQLSKPSKFIIGNYKQLSDLVSNYLGKSLVDKHDIIIQPNNSQQLTEHVMRQTRYLGIVANYHHIKHADWKKIIPIKEDNPHVFITAQSQSIHISTDNGHPPHD